MMQILLGNIIVEPDRNRIVSNGDVRRVTTREMDVLAYLMRNPTRVVGREELLESVWNDVIVNDETLTLVISRLRAVLYDTPTEPRFIETIPKKGYRLMIEPVEATRPKTTTVIKRSRWGVAAVLAILLLVMTALFIIVRVEYEHVGSAETTSMPGSE